MNVKKYLPYFLAILFFLVLTFLYFSPVLSGKTVIMHDDLMSAGNAKEAMDFYKKTGEYTWWTNSVFGGMPANMIWGSYPFSLSSKLGSWIYAFLPAPVSVIFLLMAGFFVFMVSFRKSIWVAVIASVAYAFGTYNLLYTEAGHLSKILALAYAPGILGGFALIFRGKYGLGTFVTALFLSMEIYANHLQITYYFIFILFAYFLYEIIKLWKAGEKKSLGKVVSCLAVAVLIGVGMHTMRLWNNMVYSKESTRGVSELKNSTVGNSGLTKEYAFGWSYGIDETLTLIVPNIMGGGSMGALSTKSETYKTLTSNGVDPNMAGQFVQQLPLYFGNQSITSGPAYSGIIIVFLFLLGLFLLPGKFKWVQLGLTLFFIVLAWGSNFASFNNFLFDTLPGYNKFRAVTMTLVIVHFLLVWGAANTISYLLDQGGNTWEGIKKPVTYSAGILIVLMLVGYFSMDFVGPRDAEFKSSIAQSTGPDFANKLAFALQADRKDMAWSDIIRGAVLLVLLSASVWAFYKGKLQKRVFLYAIFLLCAYDLIGVGKRYFNNNDFTAEKHEAQSFTPTAADLEILKDTDPNFKVLNVTTSFTSDSRDSYFHKSLGGYHGAKLKKTQELFDHQFVTEEGQLNKAVIDMLNTKYLIVNGPNGPMAQRNPDALGNAWFVDSLKVVPDADAELATLGNFNPKTTAVTQQNQGLVTKVYSNDSTAKLTLAEYAPNRLVYTSDNASNGFAVFSEIYYRGNQDWISYVDGKETPHQKVNYLLRGMEIPAGKHEIVFEFKPAAVEKGKYVDLLASIALVMLGVGAVYKSKRS
ncbi:YfhO family protein [Leadbetterella byssophila]|uniref:Bacterial membrane protein YfhO n=1 Tax=Leadbetterella byssophila (strain DSM 17132 / JCM 16389 / KACC 11308 / NBRC 106382 / 4M15) TaxID=649349 RepID=E4RS26_LEAB4|nr:YfhO family protein [Leadbetterella byssophila]ADQ15842.1 conserved hypothetical protein, membrane [Leadbetterella byssophila DSM 17132]